MSQTLTKQPTSGAVHEVIEKHLEPLLGGFTAKMAVRTAALRALKRPPEELGGADVPALLEGLKPMLNTFLGAVQAKAILEELTKAVEKR